MNRRHFLRQLALGATATAAWSSGFNLAAAQAAASGKSLLVVFQRGGCDGLNAVVPYGEDAYYNLRPNIAIAAAGQTDGALDLDGFFGLHPAMSPLMPFWHAGQLAVLPAVQHENASRSHFDNQQYIEAGMPLKVADGWLNRHLQTHGSADALRAVAFGNSTPHSLRGAASASSFADLNSLSLGVWGGDQERLMAGMEKLYGNDDSGREALDLVRRSGRTLLDDLALAKSLDAANYQPENGASYPGDGFGKSLAQAALLIKSPTTRSELICINHGGWDTHGGQGGAEGYQAGKLNNLASGLAAFATDLGAKLSDVVVLVMTEFGRTARENGSGGTDHGHAGAWYLLGGNVTGGVHGAWPGLEDHQLHQGRYLAHSIDFRDVLAEVTRHHLGNSRVDEVLPLHSPSPLGLFSS